MTEDRAMQVIDGKAPYHGASPWAFAVKYQFTQTDRRVMGELPLKEMTLEVQQGVQSLWVVAKWPKGGSLAIRTSFSPEEGLVPISCEKEERSITCRAVSPAGKYRVMLEVPDTEKPLIHFTVWLTPEGEMSIPFWPSDTYPLDDYGDPIETYGTVHAAQRGAAMGFIYASMTKPRSGTFLYFQNLTSLNELCEQTHAVPKNRVGGSWPELGYTLPIAERMPLRAGREIVISDAYICFSPSIPEATSDLAQLFFDLLAEIYLQIPKPESHYQDWLTMAEATVHDIKNKDCVTKVDDKTYLNAYVGTGDRRPESLVQLAVILPLLEYEDWREKKIPFIDELRETLPSFYDKEIGCIMRYPRSMKGREGQHADEKGAHEIDSWYLYHPLLNLARLALRGHKDAEKLLTDSVEYAIKAAHHFKYKWPVLFDAKTFDVIREAPTRELGETDVGGLYSYLMLQMYELTDEERYLGEARDAAEHLKGLHFNIGYQFNNAAWGANALAKLWKLTGNTDYLHLSFMSIASIVQNAFIWDCDYGYAKHYVTFMGVTPLREAPYIAAYEEMEIFAAFHEYLSIVDAHLSPSIHILITEYCKYATDGKICAYPMNLPEDVICDEPQNGFINRKLAIPLEDIYQGWEKAGQVGQEVYGAGTAPAITARAYLKIETAPFMVYYQYPIYDVRTDTDGKSCVFQVHGDPRLECFIRLIPVENKTLDGVDVRLVDDGKTLKGRRTDEGHLEYKIPGGSNVEVTWE